MLLLGQAGEVERADDGSGDGVEDGNSGAGESAEAACVVFRATHQRRLPGLEGCADSVGSRVFFAVAVAGGKADVVEHPLQAAIGCGTREYDAVGRGEDDADRFGDEVVGELVDHRPGCGDQRRLGIRFTNEGEFESVGIDVERAGTPPRREDRVADIDIDVVVAQESLAGASDES